MTHSDVEQAIAGLRRLYRQVDEEMAALHAVHGDRLRCRPGCADCCVDGITVFEAEALNIRSGWGDLLETGVPGPPGACAFLDGSGCCRIYPSRPYVCRSQGPPLRWFDDLEDGTPVEYRDICPLNAEGSPIESLPPDACWTIGPAESGLAALQEALDGGLRRRIPLRALFHGPHHRLTGYGPAGPEAPERARPWLAIPVADYEGHMATPSVAQRTFLDTVFQELLERRKPRDLAVPGCSAGTGFEHIDPDVTRRVVGIDIQPDYLDRLARRFSRRLPGLELRCEDLATARLEPSAFDLVHCALVLEYVEPSPLLGEMARWLRPDGELSVVLQLPSEHCGRVSASPYATSLAGLEPVMRLMDPSRLEAAAAAAGLAMAAAETVTLDSGKSFFVGRLVRKPSAALSPG